MALKIGDKAPEFKLKDQDGKEVSIEEFNGKNVVVLFFPFANTSVCTTEMSLIRDNIGKFNNINAQVLGISVDSPFSLKMWAEKNSFNFPLLSDFNKEVSPLYDSLYDVFAPGKFDYKGVSKRSAFVVDKNGIIKYAEICELPTNQPDYNSIEEVLKTLD
ncbi:MAG: redoxin domain-containing protein [Ignavibacteriaceae bacterium]|jgi:peroxiredoxin